MKNTGLPSTYRLVASARIPHKEHKSDALPVTVELAVYKPTTGGHVAAVMAKIGNEAPFEIKNYKGLKTLDGRELNALAKFAAVIADHDSSGWQQWIKESK